MRTSSGGDIVPPTGHSTHNYTAKGTLPHRASSGGAPSSLETAAALGQPLMMSKYNTNQSSLSTKIKLQKNSKTILNMKQHIRGEKSDHSGHSSYNGVDRV